MDIPGSEGINVYADAKTEYTRQLTQFCLPAFLGFFLHLLDETKESEKDSKKLLLSFQNALKQIPEWNYEKVQTKTSVVIKDIKCDYFEDLLSAVFVAHTKVLSAIRLTSKQKKLQITIPKTDHFLHHTMIECARILWSNVFLFSPSGPAIERQKSMRQVEQLIQDGILQSIRSMLPVKNILKEYLKDDDDADDDEDDDEEVKIKKNSEEKVEEEIEKKVEEEKQEEKVEEKKQEEKVEEKKQEEKVEEKKQEEKVEEKPKKESPVLTLPTLETTKESSIQNLEPPVISVDTEPSVKFAEVNTVIDIESNRNDSDSEDEEQESIQILDDIGESLNDFETLENEESIEFETL